MVGISSGIIELAVGHVGLAKNREGRAWLRDEQTFHGGERDGLIFGDQFSLHVAGGEELKAGGDDADEHAGFEESAAVGYIAVGEEIECADGSHHETAGLYGAEHGVSVLP